MLFIKNGIYIVSVTLKLGFRSLKSIENQERRAKYIKKRQKRECETKSSKMKENI